MSWQVGRFSIGFYWPLKMWTLGFHGKPCCYFWVECGPLEFGMVR